VREKITAVVPEYVAAEARPFIIHRPSTSHRKEGKMCLDINRPSHGRTLSLINPALFCEVDAGLV
jgi:hypothetical protein